MTTSTSGVWGWETGCMVGPSMRRLEDIKGISELSGKLYSASHVNGLTVETGTILLYGVRYRSTNTILLSSFTEFSRAWNST